MTLTCVYFEIFLAWILNLEFQEVLTYYAPVATKTNHVDVAVTTFWKGKRQTCHEQLIVQLLEHQKQWLVVKLNLKRYMDKKS